MKNRKYLIVLFIALSIIIVGAMAYVNIRIEVCYSVKNIYRENFKDYYSDSFEYDASSIKQVKKDFKMTEDEAKEFIKKPEEYAIVVFQCSITNKTPFSIVDFNFGLDSHLSGLWLLDNYFDDITTRKVSPMKSTTVLIPVLLKNAEDFNFDKLNNYSFRIYGRMNYGFFVSGNAKYKGLTNVQNCDSIELKEIVSSDREILGFLNLDHFNHELTITDAEDYFPNACSVQRYSDGMIYMISRFKDDDIDRYGIIFFDREEKLLGGVLLNQLFSNGTFDFVTENKTTFDDVKKIDKSAYMFFGDGEYTSYHYIEDGSYVKISYYYYDKKYIVKQTKVIESGFDWLTMLKSQDYELIKPFQKN